MAEIGSPYSLGHRLDVQQILSEARHRWLRPAEICEILGCYEKFKVSPQPPNKPISGSVFLFDRKVLRYFRKDGHNWRKKKDGKTVKEAHEKLKVGSVDMLHCYYAHGEDNENFQRRSYWLLEQDLMHIVFVHYLEVKGNKTTSSYARSIETETSYSENGMSFRGTSPSSTISSAFENAESEDNHQASSRFHSYAESLLTDDSHSGLSSFNDLLQHPGNQQFAAANYKLLSQGTREGEFSGGSFTSGSQAIPDLASWQQVYGLRITGEDVDEQVSGCSLPIQANWQPSYENCSFHLNNTTENQDLMLNLAHVPGSTMFEEKSLPPNQKNEMEHSYTYPDEHKKQSEQSNLQMLISDADYGNAINSNLDNVGSIHGNQNYSFSVKMPIMNELQAEESLKKVDSFSRWVDKELGEADELQLKSTTGSSWNLMGSEDDSNMPGQLQEYIDTLNPSISQDQLFSIIEFLPNWAYSNSETEVLVAGTFLKSKQELAKCRWSIMFGEVEVPAVVLADGFLSCNAPPHNPGLVPFYVTSSNRLACSEIREFEFRFESDENNDVSEHDATVMHLQQRFEKLLCVGPVESQVNSVEDVFENPSVVEAVFSSLENEKQMDAKLELINGMPQLNMIWQQLLEKPLKEKFCGWLLQRVLEGKGLTFVDEMGQGLLHLAAALGFNWALRPIIVSGVSIDFRDVNGWTALHWASFCGREDTVVALVSLGASPGALTDPSSEYPLGRPPAELAAASGHKGISGFLAETSLTAHLSSLGVTDRPKEGSVNVSAVKAVHTLSERVAVPDSEKDVPDALSLKDSLAAVCNATQAAARIHQIYRIQSFQRKQLNRQGSEVLSPDEKAVSLLTTKTSRLGQSAGVANAAATRIQKKFRGWRIRKEFLLLRQKIVKIQAHVRGHQVRKKYKPIIWSVGIMEKVILRWRRKGKGLRGFRSDAMLKEQNTRVSLLHEDNYDFLKEGRKQAEERMQKALARVKSMVHYPEARAQYRRLLTSAEVFRENKDASDRIPYNENTIYPEEDLFDLEALLDDDSFMSLAFE
ncbi:calmodulin-binding transcription activator 2-like isoform X1 [Primulina tabacum]|uniref:calmodulin-binding transcription activator 2-like isoform X1 n=1 Tax=Primulina tabacum TaxID=48773 RepID=UPI003F5AABB8